MKKWYWIGAIIVLVVVGLLFLRGDEDSWIKNGKGEYVKHGNPSSVSDEVVEQADAVLCALDLYRTAEENGLDFLSQCLGSCGDYAVDIVHDPREDIDDLAENQCDDYRHNRVGHFIELDVDGIIVRIV